MTLDWSRSSKSHSAFYPNMHLPNELVLEVSYLGEARLEDYPARLQASVRVCFRVSLR